MNTYFPSYLFDTGLVYKAFGIAIPWWVYIIGGFGVMSIFSKKSEEPSGGVTTNNTTTNNYYTYNVTINHNHFTIGDNMQPNTNMLPKTKLKLLK